MADKKERLFGELRSILNKPATVESWAELAAHLPKHTLDEYFEDAVAPYLMQHLERWDEATRVAPAEWGKPLLKEKPAPLLRFATGLDLSSSRVGPAAIKKLIKAPELASLSLLNLSGNGLKNEGAQTLAQCKHLSSLRVLILRDAKVGNAGAVALAGCAGLSQLEDLDLSGNDFIDTGCSALEHSKHLAKPIRDKAWSWYSHEREARESYYDSWE